MMNDKPDLDMIVEDRIAWWFVKAVIMGLPLGAVLVAREAQPNKRGKPARNKMLLGGAPDDPE